MNEINRAVPAECPDVFKAINGLCNSQEELKNLVSQLSERLCAVLRPQLPVECGNGKIEQYATPLAAQIDLQSDSIAMSAETIRDILCRLQI